MPGHLESGDQYVVELFPHGVLIGVIDGLGHGDKAAEAAKLAVTLLQEAATEPVEVLFRRCHTRLRHTRGVVMSLASFDTLNQTMTWLGVGNVEGVTLRPASPPAKPISDTLVLRGGIVGYNMPSLRPVTRLLAPGETLIFVTDGIRSGFVKDLSRQEGQTVSFNLSLPPQQIADHILRQYRREADDALVLVARYGGS